MTNISGSANCLITKSIHGKGRSVKEGRQSLVALSVSVSILLHYGSLSLWSNIITVSLPSRIHCIRLAFHMHALGGGARLTQIGMPMTRMPMTQACHRHVVQFSRSNACLKFKKVEFLAATNSSLAIDMHGHT